MNKFRLIILSGTISALLIAGSCKNHPTEAMDPMVSHIDSTVVPGNDFFAYANGKWFKNNPIPASRKSNGIWQLIQDTVNAQVRTICLKSAASKEKKTDSFEQKIGDFYLSGMDSTTLNKKGLSDIQPDLNRISQIKTTKDIISTAAWIHKSVSAPLFDVYVNQDEKNSSKYAVHLSQGGLSLPERSYYIDNDARAVTIRQKFSDYAAVIFTRIGYNPQQAKSAASKILDIETAIAKASRKKEDLRDPHTNYNKVTFSSLCQNSPQLDWKLFMNNFGLQKIDSVIVGQPEFFKSMNQLLVQFNVENWKDYLKFHYVNALTSYLDDQLNTESFNFYEKTLDGVQQQKPRWERVTTETNNNLGELIGQIYVKDYLPKGTKEKLLEIGNAIRTVFAEHIRNLDWMSSSTKTKALEKLNGINMKVGYPDKWKDLSTVHINKNSYVKNVISVNKWNVQYMLDLYGKPVDRSLWAMQPQTYNAYYNASNNEIVIPGCNIIVPGYERQMADDAILYAIVGGSTFGHEITHGFDDQGCKFDKNGNLNNWWTPSDSINFYSKTKKIVDQFNNYRVSSTLHINGSLTQGENIADLGGAVMGLEAFKKTVQYRKNQTLAGYTPTQRYFLGFALAWLVNMRPEAVETQVKSDEHSPAKWRVIGTLSNMPEFFEAFSVKKGNSMWRSPQEVVKIW